MSAAENTMPAMPSSLGKAAELTVVSRMLVGIAAAVR